ncbi:YXWGXW repeat-containing protein [Paludibaculum fermentans]|uniref:YXWGXW repeat-containing protein n=1 Tax=Paludibaculum fermentans TaxID=1473598 RepID=UPI003EC0625C
MSSRDILAAGWKLCLCALSASALLAGQTVVVRVGPPRPVVTRVIAAPLVRPVWVGGAYRWTGRAYVWMPAYRALPPPRPVWVAPRYGWAPVRGPRVVISGSW